jgi:hypothetical protein
MSVYTILDVAISLALIYLALSIFCSALKEWVARWLDLRSTTLRASIELILQDSTTGGIAAAFHAHPLITGLRFAKVPYPAYIPTQTFARALADLALQRVQPPLAGTGKAATAVPAGGAGAASAIAIPPGTRTLLETLLRGSLGDIAEVEARLGKWFDDSMERASGWYKRKAQLIIVGIAAVLTIGLKVDTIAITKQIWVDPTLRAALVQRAQTAVHDSTGKTLAVPDSTALRLTELQRELPMGWNCWPWDNGTAGCKDWNPEVLGLTLPGLLLSIVALSLGAPFWFDLLNKLVNLRQSGVPPDEQQKTASKR